MAAAGSPRVSGRLSPLSVPTGSPKVSLNTPTTTRGSKFAVYDLSEERGEAPKSFHEAAERGDTSWCVRTIERTLDFDVNCRDRLMRTALHWAAEMGHHDTGRAGGRGGAAALSAAAKTLMDFGVDVHTADCTGRTAVHLAAKCGDAEMLRVLLGGLPAGDAAALVNQGDHNDITPVFLAVQRGEEGQEAFEWLMQHGARYTEQAPEAGAAAS
ncbi:hypothetical protein Rsub_05846 [Raphidocelis subcapitata]|uniref:Uncharacterized protein n=1 Tax=Raphidocelis subcapitata TaxID=307507 RepID=A0A2V0P7F1_9CHLO|nr:hypothetical protein Rsub_05846 [Raphidocelis subcapitata]|eukprot:GBF93117.1 hypothetical protein Rsub_05846 [Raphidocelis subcapitata]